MDTNPDNQNNPQHLNPQTSGGIPPLPDSPEEAIKRKAEAAKRKKDAAQKRKDDAKKKKEQRKKAGLGDRRDLEFDTIAIVEGIRKAEKDGMQMDRSCRALKAQPDQIEPLLMLLGFRRRRGKRKVWLRPAIPPKR